MFRFSRFRLIGGSAAVLLGFSPLARATEFAQYDAATPYVSGTLDQYHTGYDTPTVVNSPPSGLTGVDTIYQGVVNVFNPPYDTDQLVTIGPGGQITLQFPHPVNVAAGQTVGVFSNVALTNAADFGGDDGFYPSEIPAGEPLTFGGGTPDVQVSADGKHWVDLGPTTIDMPENYYLNAGEYDFAAPANPQLADFGLPFLGTPDSFDNMDFSQINATLGGSAGGDWLNLSASGLPQVNYIQFSEPAGGENFSLQAVSVSDAVPEPAGLGILVLGGLLLRRRPRNA